MIHLRCTEKVTQEWFKLVYTAEVNPKCTKNANSMHRKTIDYKFATLSDSYVCL